MCLALRSAALALAVLSAAPARAADYTWTGAAATDTWSEPANWTAGPPVSSADTAVIFGASSASVTPNQDVANPFLLNSLTFTGAAPSYTLGGGPLSFQANSSFFPPTLTQNSANAQVVTQALVLGADLGVSASGALTLSGDISGAGGLTKTGAGTLTLSGASTFAGLLNVVEGSLTIAGGSLAPQDFAIGDSTAASVTQTAGTVTVLENANGGGTLVLGSDPAGDAAYTLAGGTLTTTRTVVGRSGSGAFAQTGGTHVVNVNGVLTLAASNAAAVGTYALSAGTLDASAASVTVGNLGTGTFTQTGGTVTARNATVGGNAGADGTLTVTNAGSTWSGESMILGGNPTARGGLTVSNGGAVTLANELVLGGANSSVTVDGGTLAVGTLMAAADGTGQKVFLTDPAGGSALTIGGNNASSELALVLADGANGPGGLTKVGAGTLTLTGANTYTGPTVVAAGTLQFGASDVLADAGRVVLGGGTLSTGAAAGYSEAVGPLAVTAGSTIALGTGSHTLTFGGLDGGSTGSLTVTGWTGPRGESGTGGQLLFQLAQATPADANAAYAAFLGGVQFVGFQAGGMFLGTGSAGVYELAPTPEPGTALGVAAAGLGLAGWVRRKRAARAA